jgi:hypothetical protein
MKWITTLLILIILLLWAGSALAMSSTNYRLDWFTPMTGGGGGLASSAHYTANLTVGQTVVGASISEHYGSGQGYWYGLLSEFIRNFLPQVLRN